VDKDEPYQVIQRYTKAASLKRKLRRTLLALIGYRVKGMSEVSFDELELKFLLGPRLVHYGIDELRKMVGEVEGEKAKSLWEEVKRKVGEVKVGEKEAIYSSKVYLALKKLAEKDNLSGFALECYPELMGEVCLASSLLSEEGIPCSCEGDVNSLVAMLILNFLTRAPVHNTDLLALYEKENCILFSHCGSGGFSLAEDSRKISLSPVRLANRGLCVLFPAKAGRVTLMNLVGRKGTYRMCVLEGEALPSGMLFAGNPVKVKFPIPLREFLQIVADNGFGHHWMIGYGKVKEEVQDFCELIGLRRVIV
jgi:L-arabinose isomerase